MDQPSTHAIGRSAVTDGRDMSSALVSSRALPPTPTSSNRQSSPVASAVMPAADAVRLTWNALGPDP